MLVCKSHTSIHAGKLAIDLAREAGHTDTVELLEKEMRSDGKPVEHQSH